MREDVHLFWPLLLEAGISKQLFPTQLRPETEQWLAMEQWQNQYPGRDSSLNAAQRSRLVRNLLDLGQLAGAAGWTDRQVRSRLTAGEIRVTPGRLVQKRRSPFGNIGGNGVWPGDF
ncbi:hypothetical protein NON20_04040 [Synechocystis sp. B12]|nr:hypothetical protein NON20_04040 [Synechocystis sp. B12]